jgi:hypothetical protein
MSLMNELREVAQALAAVDPLLAQRLMHIAARVGRLEAAADEIVAAAQETEHERHVQPTRSAVILRFNR